MLLPRFYLPMGWQCNRFSRNWLILSMTRSPARGLATKMLQSSAYRTKRSPRRANSQSNSFRTTFDNNGERGPPCGVPSSVATEVPSGITTRALSILPIRTRTLLSWIFSASLPMSRWWFTRSKNLAISRACPTGEKAHLTRC